MQILTLPFMQPRHGRLLHAHFDGSKLIVRRTPLYCIEPHDIDLLRFFVRYGVSKPVGGTCFI